MSPLRKGTADAGVVRCLVQRYLRHAGLDWSATLASTVADRLASRGGVDPVQPAPRRP